MASVAPPVEMPLESWPFIAGQTPPDLDPHYSSSSSSYFLIANTSTKRVSDTRAIAVADLQPMEEGGRRGCWCFCWCLFVCIASAAGSPLFWDVWRWRRASNESNARHRTLRIDPTLSLSIAIYTPINTTKYAHTPAKTHYTFF